jgi:hypothetical protein
MRVLGLCEFDKKYIPWLYMLVVYFTIPTSSFIGHFCGLIAGLLLKFTGLYVFLPRYEWIKEFDDVYADKLEAIGYSRCSENISKDFDAYVWTTILKCLKH